MREKFLFLIKVLVFSILLFLLWSQIITLYAWLVAIGASFLRDFFGAGVVKSVEAKSSYLLVAFISVLLAASGLTLRRKLKWIAFGIFSMILSDTLTVATEIVRLAEQYRSGTSGLSFSAGLLAISYHALVLLLPFLLLLLAVQGRVEELWSPLVLTISPRVCPICGKERTGLIEHIRTTHGEKALKSWRVRRYLARVGLI